MTHCPHNLGNQYLSVGLSILNKISLVIFIIYTVWEITRDDLLAKSDLKLGRQGLSYWLYLEKIIEKQNLKPLMNLVTGFVGVVYLDKHMEGLFFVVGVLAVLFGSMWQVIKLIKHPVA